MNSPIISSNPRILSDEIQRLKDGSLATNSAVDAVRSLTAKNLNLYPYRDTTKTTNGITFTDVGDGTVTASGTASDSNDALFHCHPRTPTGSSVLTIPNGTYRISGCPAGGSTSTYRIHVLTTKNSSASTLVDDYGEGATFKASGDDSSTTSTTVEIRLDVMKKYAITDTITFKPMLEVISLDDPEAFQEWSMTNNELTKIVNALKCSETTAGTYKLEATVDASGNITYEWVEVV